MIAFIYSVTERSGRSLCGVPRTKTGKNIPINMCSETFNLLVITARLIYKKGSKYPPLVQCMPQHVSSWTAASIQRSQGSCGIITIHNQHQWSGENLHGIIHSRHQQQFNTNAWAEIVGDCLVGTHILPHRFTGGHYRDFLLPCLPKLLKNIPLADRARMKYMHDGAPANFSRSM
jgi:hypothetical protein